jgi:hypothetical protein
MPVKLERSDVFTSFNDIALFGPLQVAQVVFLLNQNEFTDPQIERIDVDISTIQPIRLLQVQSIQTDKEVYQPGETVRYVVELKPYRGEQMKVTGSFQLPEELNARRLTLHVFGGPRRQRDSQTQTLEYTDLEQLIEALEKATTNDQLTVELLGLPREGGEDEDSSFQDIQRLGDWVVTGEERTTIQIELPKPEEPEGPEEQKPEEQPEQKPEEIEEPECDQPFYC